MPATSHRQTWDERIARARDLAAARPAAHELLTFYAALAEYQKSLAARAPAIVDADHIVGEIPGFLEWLRRVAPPDLAASVQDLDRVDLARSAVDLAQAVASEPSYQTEGSDSPALQFAVESLLQAFAEHLVTRTPAPTLEAAAMRCPRCAGLPVAAVLREAGHGARRSLLCALCLTEWDSLRLVCPACGEQQFDALPIYTADQFPHVRIDACDRCRHYLKTIDLTKDGHAVPCVDDIASVSLDLWAREQGYTRVKSNLLGF